MPGRSRVRARVALGPLLRAVAWPVGLLLGVVALIMLLSAGVGLLAGSVEGAWHMVTSAGITAALAGGLLVLGRHRERRAVDRREALLIVSISWVTLSVVGGLPFQLGADFSMADAIFESTSGFTTTGATVLPEIRERLNPALHFWRMLSHWLGGMGIVVLFVAIFPALGVGGKHLFRTEVPGPRSKGLSPRISQTSLRLWWTYFGITALIGALLLAAGLPPFEAITHAFSTLGTGGFSTMNGSIAGLRDELGLSAVQAVAAEWIIFLGMVLAGMNFGLFYDAWRRGPRVLLRHSETRVYLGILAAAGLLIGASLLPSRLDAGMRFFPALHEALRDALFQVAAVASTTGFGTDDFELWPTFAKMLLLGLYFTGGCSGSTAGGMKLIRWIILLKATAAELRRSFRPHLVVPVRVGRQVISAQHMVEILAFTALFLVTVAAGAAAVALLQSLARSPIDGTTAVMASLACVANVGPGLGMVGPTDNFGFFSGASKLVLSACMLLGRLEFVTVLALLVPSFWRR